MFPLIYIFLVSIVILVYHYLDHTHRCCNHGGLPSINTRPALRSHATNRCNLGGAALWTVAIVAMALSKSSLCSSIDQFD